MRPECHCTPSHNNQKMRRVKMESAFGYVFGCQHCGRLYAVRYERGIPRMQPLIFNGKIN